MSVYTNLIAAFEQARVGDRRRRVETNARLRTALQEARRLGDYGQLPCPIHVWIAALNLFEAWLEASDEVRDGPLSDVAYAMLGCLLRFCASSNYEFAA